jgi:hypothetical protein
MGLRHDMSLSCAPPRPFRGVTERPRRLLGEHEARRMASVRGRMRRIHPIHQDRGEGHRWYLCHHGVDRVGDIPSGRRRRRHEYGDDGVATTRGRECGYCLTVIGGGCVTGERQLDQLQAGRATGLRAELPGPAAVRHDGHAGARGGRLIRQQGRGLEELCGAVGADDAGLAQDGVGADVGVGQKTRRRRVPRPAASEHHEAALHREDGFVRRDLPRDADEPAWVAEGLEIEQHDRRRAISAPVGEGVVARYVGLATDVDKRRDAEAEPVCGGGESHPDAAALRHQRDRSAGGHRPDEAGVQRRRGIGVQCPQ